MVLILPDPADILQDREGKFRELQDSGAGQGDPAAGHCQAFPLCRLEPFLMGFIWDFSMFSLQNPRVGSFESFLEPPSHAGPCG